ncbi:MAG: PD40 domain-containing protein [Bacteroidales bacterium]|nr:PD40 domain-containing protein [Bacteroidales bacterium]
MRMNRIINIIISLTVTLTAYSCSSKPEGATQSGEEAPVFPDYKEVTIPANIAPLNFSFLGEGTAVLLSGDKVIRSRRGTFRFSPRKWRQLLEGCSDNGTIAMTVFAKKKGTWISYRPFNIYVSQDRIDPWFSYRLIPPGYQGWQEMGIYQRNLETYSEKAILTNDLTGGNCMNCHTYRGGDPSKMVFHARASFGGTVMVNDGEIEKLNTQTDSTISALVYPYWHPSGEYVAFSVNKTFQAFHNHDPNRIEVYDQASDVVVYNVKTHEIAWSPLTKSKDRFETFPTFSPDGKWLYFCSAQAVEPMPNKYKEVRYGLYRIAFNQESMAFGDSLECIYDAPADSASVSFPRISPDGRFLCFTRHGYGNFSIWHKDADLWMVDLADGLVKLLEGVNSEDVDSFHTWSADGRWMVFSSRRDDGLYTKPYFTHIDSEGNATKPFLLPQKDPVNYYKRLMKSYNLPAFTTDKVSVSKRKLTDVLRNSPGTDVKVK